MARLSHQCIISCTFCSRHGHKAARGDILVGCATECPTCTNKSAWLGCSGEELNGSLGSLSSLALVLTAVWNHPACPCAGSAGSSSLVDFPNAKAEAVSLVTDKGNPKLAALVGGGCHSPCEVSSKSDTLERAVPFMEKYSKCHR